MTIIELLSQRLSTLKDNQAELELVLENLHSCNDEIALVEKMLSLGEVEPTPPVVIETPVEEPTTPKPHRHTPEELFRAEGRIV